MRTGHRGTPPAGRPAGGRGAAQAAPGRTASGDRAARRWAAAAGGPLRGAGGHHPTRHGRAAGLHPGQPATAGQPGRHLTERPTPRSGGLRCSPAPAHRRRSCCCGAPSGPRPTGSWSSSGPTCCSGGSRPARGGHPSRGNHAMNAPSAKLQPRHLRRRAVVYVRQSTPRQVINNQESTRRQYQLAERARQMGWTASQIEVVDDDLGLSGASSQARLGFQRLVAAIGLGEVGIVLVTEVSRLSRRNSDWHRVIELCAVFRTLIADEDGVYDTQDPNDLLLLGVKGTLFAAELHILRGRMRGNLLNKARRGDLAQRLPVGFRRRPDGVVVQDPDDAVRLAITTVFERFAVLRSARAVQRHFLDNRLTLPRCSQTGATAGSITWMRPTYQMIQQILTNPAYAGVFVSGRRRRQAVPGDPPATPDRRVALAEWDIVVPDIYPAYLSYDTYLANRRALRDNLYNFANKGRGAPREGFALLTGLVVCGRCGRRMTVSYGSAYHRYHCRRAQVDYGEPLCQSCPVGALDAVVTAAFLEAIAPVGIEATLAALETLEREREAVDRQWQLRLERAHYEVALAQRQY